MSELENAPEQPTPNENAPALAGRGIGELARVRTGSNAILAQPTLPDDERADLIAALRRDAAGGHACTVFELDRAADLLEGAALRQPGALPAPVPVSDEGRRFTDWVIKHGGMSLAPVGDSLETDRGLALPTYDDDRTEIAWRAWHAALSRRPAADGPGALPDEAEDAARYKWLVQSFGKTHLPGFLERRSGLGFLGCALGKGGIDAFIDAARAAAAKGE